MTSKAALFAILAAFLFAGAPAKADPPDAPFLPQCRDGTMFRLLMMRCLPYDTIQPGEDRPRHHHYHEHVKVID